MGTKGRSRILGLTPEQKVAATKFVWTLYKYFVASTRASTTGTVDLVMHAKIASQIFTLHNAMRQKNNETKGSAYLKYEKSGNITINCHGVTNTIKVTDLTKAYEDAMAECQFTWANKATWMGSVQTIISLWNMFGVRLNDCRITATGLQIVKAVAEKGTTVTKEIGLDTFGLPPAYRQYAVGCNWQPFMRASLAQSLGPMTQAIMLSHSEARKFSENWENAVIRTFSHIPSVETMARFIRTNPASENTEIIKILAMIISIVGAREQNRLSLPTNLLFVLLNSDATNPKFNEDIAKTFDYSGKGAWTAYKLFQEDNQIKMTLNIDNEAITQQLIFHSIFGSYVEDFGILEFITDYKATASLNKTAKAVSLIPIKHYSKMSNALAANFTSISTKPSNAKMQFSGYRTRLFTETMKEAVDDEGRAMTMRMDKSSITSMLYAYYNLLINRTDRKNFQADVMKWRSIEKLTSTTHGDEVEEKPTERGIMFFGN
ncbi:hypothetical protein B4U79_11970 [Dinothrombium tinctorium]|uniref:Nucleoprotein n=1 Tax=Dinothrombium tinctorium TaxID=1965070 RepID=A0A3S3PGI8_9ACAR|nr:hypothetical protein B4U79_11970 [Dinothrombium tinctorium]